MTDDDNKPPPAAVWHPRAAEPRPARFAETVADYKSRQEAERAKMFKLRELRLAPEPRRSGSPA